MRKKKATEMANITQGEEVVQRNVLAQAIVNISSAMEKLVASGLNREAIIVLVSHRVKAVNRMGHKPSAGDIRSVFNALAQLKSDFVK